MASRYERFWQQLEEVQAKHGRRPAVWPPTAKDDNDIKPLYVYEPDRVLCRNSDVERVLPGLTRYNGHYEFDDHVTVIELVQGSDVQQECDNARLADKLRNNGVEKPDLVTPIHWVSITPVDLCPADEPVPPDTDSAVPWPSLHPDPNAGAGVKVLVVDTGVWDGFRAGHPWLSNVVEPMPQNERDAFQSASNVMGYLDIRVHDINDDQDVIKQYAGHGVFCAGVVAAAARGAEIYVAKLLEKAGALPETDFCKELIEALDRIGWPHIVSLSAGVGTMNGQPLVGLCKLFDALAQHPQTLLVAAAGNDAEHDAIGQGSYHFQPASHAHCSEGSIISVGALREDGEGLACFTNYGSSVSVYACGENHVNAFLPGTYIYRHDRNDKCRNHDPAPYQECTCTTGRERGSTAQFQWSARWSGTSFATPLVAGMIARRLSANLDRGARKVAADLIAEAKCIEDRYYPDEKIRVLL